MSTRDWSRATFRKSLRSSNGGNATNCVEVAREGAWVAVRDSKCGGRHVIEAERGPFADFLRGAASGRFVP